MIIKVHKWNAGFQPAPRANRGLYSAGKDACVPLKDALATPPMRS
jgi:hypothetical protein